MKKTIEIDRKLSLFSHRPGIMLPLPNTYLAVQCFPTRLKVVDLTNDDVIYDLYWDLKGPLKPFTGELNLDREEIALFGEGDEGFFRFYLKAEKGNLTITFDRLPNTTMSFLFKNEKLVFEPRQKLSLPVNTWDKTDRREKLFLGSNKKLEIEKINQLEDLVPLWFYLSQSMPCEEDYPKLGTGSLITNFIQAYDSKDGILAENSLEKIFLGCFKSCFIPRLVDDDYQGLLGIDEQNVGDNPYPLLAKGGELLRPLFFKEEGDAWDIFPLCLPSITRGRIVGLITSFNEQIDMQWSNRLLKKIHILTSEPRSITLNLPKEIKRYRYRTSLKDKGVEVKSNKPIDLPSHSMIYLDRFQK